MNISNQPEVSYFQFNKIYVLESLPPGERQTGKELYDDVLRWAEYRHGWFRSSYATIETRKQLLGTMAAIRRDVLRKGIFPLIHLEGHGSPAGFALTKGMPQHIGWSELADALRKINVATKNNLLLSVASCHGSHIYKGIDITDRAPFFGFIAPLEEVSPAEIVEGYQILYDRIIRTDDFDGAVLALRDMSEGPQRKFTYQHCETVLHHVAGKILTQLHDPTYRSQRLLSMTVKSLANVHLRLNYTIPGIVARSEQILSKSDEQLSRWLDNFMMKDLQ